MRKTLHSGASHLMTLIYALALSGILPACTDDADRDLPDSGKGGTVTLELSLSVPPMVETKAVICEADSASEARKAGFYYEMQVQTTDTTGNAGGSVATKAASSLKNIYAFLFYGNAFNGRASIKEPVDLSKNLLLKFTDVRYTSYSCRLVIIANDAAGADYKSSTNFDSFTSTYAEFQKLTLESDITKDEDIPYVGSTTVSLDEGVYTLSTPVPLYRMLAKIVLYNKNFNIEGGPARDSINLHKAGNKYFDTPNGYDGAGDTQTIAERLTTVTVGKNETTNTWYVGENVQTTDSTNAAYIELKTAVIDRSNTLADVGVGEKYILSGGEAYKYKVYLKDYALRRNNVYTVRVNVSGDLAFHQALASTEGSNVSEESTVVHGGLNIGMYGGAEGYTQGEVDATTISGTYTKYLLLQPNTSGTTDPDNIIPWWSPKNGITYQPDTRKYWDPTYTLARMYTGSGYAYNYCNKLTIGNVPEGTWYVPTIMQLEAIYGILGGIKKNSFYANYSAFATSFYWSATERNATDAWLMNFLTNGQMRYDGKSWSYRVRCVRDLFSGNLSAQTVIIDGDNHPVIDLSALQPLGAALSFADASERRTEMNNATPSNASYLPGEAAVSGENGTWNAQMSGKFQVMCADHTGRTMNWATAYEACKSYNEEGSRAAGEWRLPTQRELTQIMILHPQLINKGDFQALTAKAYYWSLTESNASSAWFLDTSNGQINYSNKTNNYSVRCIRDVE